MPNNILHMLFSGERASPFDINMAVDAGYQTVVPHTGVQSNEVEALVQDSIFSRPPGAFKRTGLFIGGRDVNEAAEMLAAAAAAMVPPFENCVLADPNGAYTTSAALVALVDHHLQHSGSGLSTSEVVIFGGGPVGVCTAVLAAQAGASVAIARLTPASAAKREAMERFLDRYRMTAAFIDAESEPAKRLAMRSADVLISTARAGVEVLSTDLMQSSAARVAADVNAVPPAGIAGVSATDNGVKIPGGQCLGVGALAIGNIKYKTQQALLKGMLAAERALVLDFPDAYASAQHIVADS